MVIKCCYGCVAPKRHTACWDHCPEYIAEKAKHEELKEADYLKRKISNDIHIQRANRIRKIMRHRGRK